MTQTPEQLYEELVTVLSHTNGSVRENGFNLLLDFSESSTLIQLCEKDTCSSRSFGHTMFRELLRRLGDPYGHNSRTCTSILVNLTQHPALCT